MRCSRARTYAPTSSGSSYSERSKGIIDLLSYLVLFFPTMITLMVISIDDAWLSYIIGERSQESMWRAIMWPFRAIIPLAALLFMIQGISEVAQVRVPDPLRAGVRA